MTCFYCNKEITVACLSIAISSANGNQIQGLLHSHAQCFEEMAGEEIMMLISLALDKLEEKNK